MKNKLTIIIRYVIGFFLSPEYQTHILPITKLNKSYRPNYVNHYQSADIYRNKSNTKIRNFSRNSKTNFM